VGAVYVVAKNAAANRCVGSQVRRIIRSLYSNPPAHGARIVAEVLKDNALKTEWGHDLEKMRQRLNGIRHILIAKLSAKAPERDFHFLSAHKGMFSFLDLNKSQVRRLVDEFGVYLIESGRISLAGLTPKNIDYVVDSILSV
jgi:aspartate/tyrosine/aromatic aminotransferase